jgi:hypothetical protein
MLQREERMSTDTTAPTITPKHIAKYLTNAGETFDRILTEDDIARRCFREYCFSLLDQLGVRQHSLLDMAGRDNPTPTVDQTEHLLQRFAERVKERHGRFYDVYEEHFLSMLQRYSYEWLSQHAGYDESQTLLHNAAKAIPHEMTRQWDNPVRFTTDPMTGARRFGDLTSSTTVRHMLEARALLKELDPAVPAKKRGRPKGSSKAAGSGRKPSVDQDVYKEAWEAKQGTRKYQPIPWWRGFARKRNMPIPEDRKAEDALRKKLEEWALKGKTLTRKKVGG